MNKTGYMFIGILVVFLLAGAGCSKTTVIETNLQKSTREITPTQEDKVQVVPPSPTTEVALDQISIRSCTQISYQQNRSQFEIWKEIFTKTHPQFRRVYDVGTHCELSNGNQLVTFSYFGSTEPASQGQTVVLFDSNRNLLHETKDLNCQAYGDAPTPFIDSLENDKLYVSCRVADKDGNLTVKKEKFLVDMDAFSFREL